MITLLSFLPDALAQDKPIALSGARLIPISGPEIERGVLVVQNGKIASVGSLAEVSVPPDAELVDVSGRVLMPGLVCTHSHVGGIGGADASAPINPDIRIFDSLNPLDAGYRRVVAGGLTTINVMPGSGHLLSGQTTYLKMRGGNRIEDMFWLDDQGRPMGGMKMANGTNSMRAAPFPGTRGKSAAMMRQQFIKAVEYREKIARADGDPEKTPSRDLALEGLVEVLEGKRVVHYHTHRHDDILTVLRLAREFGFRVVLHHVSEGALVAEEIAEANVPCSVILVDSPGGKLEAANLAYETAGVLERAGVKVAFHTDDWITDSRIFSRMAALGVRGGMSRAGALRALTLSGAEILDLGDRIGSLDAGKDADFVVLSGDPLSVYSKVLQTWVDGRKVFDRDDPIDRLHAVGGYGAGNDQEPYFCCFDHQD
ncbi:MAG: amidohydrolase family protein [Phycisphaerae bacterium]|nr:amidohydrolase family protein [Phycisphaerae bacterium]